MLYFKRVFENIKTNIALFQIIAIFVAISIGFHGFQEDKLPVFLRYNLLIIYLCILSCAALIVLLICVFEPLVTSQKLVILFQYALKVIERISNNPYQILVVTMVLASIGMIMVYSSSILFGRSKYGNSDFFAARTMIYNIVGILFCLISSHINYSLLKKYSPY